MCVTFIVVSSILFGLCVWVTIVAQVFVPLICVYFEYGLKCAICATFIVYLVYVFVTLICVTSNCWICLCDTEVVIHGYVTL